MSAEDEDVTDNIPVPQTATSGNARPVVIEHDGTASNGSLRTVSGDVLVIVSEATLTMDAQVQVKTADDAVSGTGMVIWTRDEGSDHVVGVEILGGTGDWAGLG